MPFTIEQISSLELVNKDGDIFAIAIGELQAVGEHEVISKPQFKEDQEERLVRFSAKKEKGEIKVEVTYSIGMSGQEVQDVNVVKIPDGLEIHSSPEFETQDHDDDEA